MSKQGRCNSCCNNDCSCWMKCCGGEDKSVNRDENGDNYNCVNTYGCIETQDSYTYSISKVTSIFRNLPFTSAPAFQPLCDSLMGILSTDAVSTVIFKSIGTESLEWYVLAVIDGLYFKKIGMHGEDINIDIVASDFSKIEANNDSNTYRFTGEYFTGCQNENILTFMIAKDYPDSDHILFDTGLSYNDGGFSEFIYKQTKPIYLESLSIGDKGKCTYESYDCLTQNNGWNNVKLICPVKNDCIGSDYDGTSFNDLLFSHRLAGNVSLLDIDDKKYYTNTGEFIIEAPLTLDEDIIDYINVIPNNFVIGGCDNLTKNTSGKTLFCDINNSIFSTSESDIISTDLGIGPTFKIGTIFFASCETKRHKFYTIEEITRKNVDNLFNTNCRPVISNINNSCTSCSSVWLDEIGYVDKKLYVNIFYLNTFFEFSIYYNGIYWSSSTTICSKQPDALSGNNTLYRNENVSFLINGRNCVLDVKSITSEYDPFFGTVPPLPLNIVFTLPQKQCVYHIGDVVITQDSFKSPLFVRGYPAIVYITGTGTEVTYAQ